MNNNERLHYKKEKGGKNMLQKLKSSKGFTLVELLIVVIILSVLAAVIIPQFGSSTADAKAATLDATLAEMRNAIERYYHDHTSVYPGTVENDGATAATALAGSCDTAFIEQLTRYSELTGKTSPSKTALAKYGPYIKRAMLPTNPFNDLNTILCDVTETDITVAASSGVAAWKFYTKTGRVVANDGAHDSN
jgi:prepilin-type N-terminal cleavage/methylation domain-containing protein